MLKCSPGLWGTAHSGDNFLWDCHYEQPISHTGCHVMKNTNFEYSHFNSTLYFIMYNIMFSLKHIQICETIYL